MIWGYPARPTVLPGEVVDLHVSTDAPAWHVDFYRWGTSGEYAGSAGPFPGADVPHHLAYEDWGRPGVDLGGRMTPPWPAHPVDVPAGRPPGVYVGVLVEGEGEGGGEGAGGPPAEMDLAALDARDARLLLVVRPAAPPAPGARPPLLYKLPLFTWHAYGQVAPRNFDPATQAGGWSLYSIPRFEDLPREVPLRVSLHRPGGGIGGTPWDHFNADPFQPRTLRQTFAHYDAPVLAWLEREGHEVDVCTDLDLHDEGEGLLRGYRLLVSAGHDEYWSVPMRRAVEAFVEGGGNAAFLGGNTMWWHVDPDADGTFSRTGQWASRGEPEDALTGVSFRHGGERHRDDPRDVPVGYRVQHADHWLYEGTGVRDGDVFGDGAGEHLVGYECDGAAFDRVDWDRTGVATPTGEDGTPGSFTILGVGDLVPAGWGQGNRAATFGLWASPGGGTVVNAATTDWPRLLVAGHPVVGRITRNVLARLG